MFLPLPLISFNTPLITITRNAVLHNAKLVASSLQGLDLSPNSLTLPSLVTNTMNSSSNSKNSNLSTMLCIDSNGRVKTTNIIHSEVFIAEKSITVSENGYLVVKGLIPITFDDKSANSNNNYTLTINKDGIVGVDLTTTKDKDIFDNIRIHDSKISSSVIYLNSSTNADKPNIDGNVTIRSNKVRK